MPYGNVVDDAITEKRHAFNFLRPIECVLHLAASSEIRSAAKYFQSQAKFPALSSASTSVPGRLEACAQPLSSNED